MKKAFIYLLVFIAVQFAVSYAVLFIWQLAAGSNFQAALASLAAGNLSAPMLIVASAVYSVILLVLFLRRKWSIVSRSYLKSRPWGVFFWCVLIAIGTIIPSEWMQEQLPDLPDIMKATFAMIMRNDWGYLTICIFAPIVEEIVFRGAILRVLLGWFDKHWYAIILSALLFALVHGNPAQMPHAFLIGLLIGWMYYRTGSILPGIVVHWVNNTAAWLAFNLMPAITDMKLIDVFGGNGRSLFLSILFSLFIFLPALYQLNARMKRA